MSSWTTIERIRKVLKRELDIAFGKHKDYTIHLIYINTGERHRRKWKYVSSIANAAMSNSFNMLTEYLNNILRYVNEEVITPIMVAKYAMKLLEMKMDYQSAIKKLDESMGYDTLTNSVKDFLFSYVVNDMRTQCTQVLASTDRNELESSCRNLSELINQQIHTSFQFAKVDYVQFVGEYISHTVPNVNFPIFTLITNQTDNIFMNLENNASIKITNCLIGCVNQAIENTSKVLPTNTKFNDVMRDIRQMLTRQDFNGAFYAALLGPDSFLVEYVCQMVDPNLIFEQGCGLSFPVLLSLIRELGESLCDRTWFKVVYLSKALPYLNPNNLVYREFIPFALKGIPINVGRFLEKFPSHELRNNLVELANTSENLIKTCYM